MLVGEWVHTNPLHVGVPWDYGGIMVEVEESRLHFGNRCGDVGACRSGVVGLR